MGEPTVQDYQNALAQAQGPAGPTIADYQNALAQAQPKSSSWLDSSIPGGTPRGYIHGITNAIPYVAGAGGAALGSTVGPAGTVGGAGLGYAAGSKAKDIINDLLDEGSASIKKPTLQGTAEAFKSVPGDVATGAENEMAGQIIGAGAKAAANTPLGKYISKKAGAALSTIGSAFTGMTKDELETYASNPEEINQIAKESGYNSQTLADNLRSEINASIQETKKDLYSQLNQTFEQRAGQTVDSKPIIDQLTEAQTKINPKLWPEQIDQVEEMIAKVKNLADENGQMSLANANDLKQYLHEQASGTYSKSGQIFTNGKQAQLAAKGGGAVTRKIFNAAAPEAAGANDVLSRLHDAEDVINKSMLAEGKSGASLFSAGSGANETNAAALEELGNITGKDFLGAAKKISAARAFGKAPILPVDATGKSFTRIGTSAFLGKEAAGIPGAIISGSLSSPLVNKGIINASSLGSNLVKSVMENAPSIGGAAARGISNEFSSQNNPPGYWGGGTVSQPPANPDPKDNSSATYIDQDKAKDVQDSMRKAFHFATGGSVPIDSPSKDTTLIAATPGEVVLPLSVTQSPNAPQKAKEFMANEMMQNGGQPQQGQLQQQDPAQAQLIQQAQTPSQKPMDPQKGPEKWAFDGFQNLMQHVPDDMKDWLHENKAKLLLDTKAKNLLITASSFKPGSKPLDDVVKHLQTRFGGKK